MSKLETPKTACKPFELSDLRIDDSGQELMSEQPLTGSLQRHEIAADEGSSGCGVVAPTLLSQLDN